MSDETRDFESSEEKKLELAYLRKRWRAVYGEEGAADRDEHGFVGLAFSGGGIRSATFNLGILQGLHRLGVFRHIDYLSTVSGGGFIGATLSYLMGAPGSSFPFDDNRALNKHLYQHANYLGPKGLGQRTVGLMLRGMVANFLLILPVLLLVALGLLALYPGLAAPAKEQQLRLKLTLVAFAFWLFTVLGTVVVYAAFKRYRRFRSTTRGADTSALLNLRDTIQRAIANALLLVPLAVLLDLTTLLVPLYHGGPAVWWLVVIALLALLLVAAVVDAARVAALAAIGGLLLYVPTLFLVAWLGSPDRFAWLEAALCWLGWEASVELVAIGLVVAVYAGVFLTSDTNISSMHGFYRDALARSFLVDVAPSASGEPDYDTVGDVRLDSINQPGSAAPYHLFNAALNLQGNADDVARGRSSDFFTFSRDTVGSKRTCYCRTADMVAAMPKLNLPAVMAISGAAATAYMGRYTSSLLGLPLTLLNFRLGTWVPNPKRIRQAAKSGGRVGRWRARAWLFFRELLGQMHERGGSVYLSDGGHLDNSGIYQLLRRRCRYIIAGDADADPEHLFDNLARLIRYARLDLGAVIDLDLEPLYLDAESGFCLTHGALARIQYDSGRTGLLLYFKPSLTGDEPPTIRSYAAVNPGFPHESSANQFFDEGQFESYRELGEHAVLGLSPDDMGGPSRLDSFEDFEGWFYRLDHPLSADPGP